MCSGGAVLRAYQPRFIWLNQVYKVAILEAQRIGFGASGRNGGQVSGGQRMDQEGLEAILGDEHARELWDISQQSVDFGS